MHSAAPPDMRGVKRARGTAPRCVVCYDHDVTTMASPCKCVCACSECAAALQGKACPVCRVRVDEWTRVYIAYDAAPKAKMEAGAAVDGDFSMKRISEALFALTYDSLMSKVIEAMQGVREKIAYPSPGRDPYLADGESLYEEALLRNGGAYTVLNLLQNFTFGTRSELDTVRDHGTYIINKVATLPAKYNAQISALRAGPCLFYMAHECVKEHKERSLLYTLDAYFYVLISEKYSGSTHALDTLERNADFFLGTEMKTTAARYEHGALHETYTQILCQLVVGTGSTAIRNQTLQTLLDMRVWSDVEKGTLGLEMEALHVAVHAPGGIPEPLLPRFALLLKFACDALQRDDPGTVHENAVAVIETCMRKHSESAARAHAPGSEDVDRAIERMRSLRKKTVNTALSDAARDLCRFVGVDAAASARS